MTILRSSLSSRLPVSGFSNLPLTVFLPTITHHGDLNNTVPEAIFLAAHTAPQGSAPSCGACFYVYLFLLRVLEMWLSITTGTISVFPGSFFYSDMFKGWKADFDFMD